MQVKLYSARALIYRRLCAARARYHRVEQPERAVPLAYISFQTLKSRISQEGAHASGCSRFAAARAGSTVLASQCGRRFTRLPRSSSGVSRLRASGPIAIPSCGGDKTNHDPL